MRQVRPTAAQTLRHLADLTDLVWEEDVADKGWQSERFRTAAAEMTSGIENLVADLRNYDVEHSSDPFAAASVVNQLRRCLRAFEVEPARPHVRSSGAA